MTASNTAISLFSLALLTSACSPQAEVPDPGIDDTDTTDPGESDAPVDTDDDAPTPDPEDLDADEVADAIDNCPGIANPAQRDFDSDGEGDACDALDRPLASGTLTSTLVLATASLGRCELPAELELVDGAIRLTLRDDATGAQVDDLDLTVDVITDPDCELNHLLTLLVDLDELLLDGPTDGAAPSLPTSAEDIDAGTLTGTTSAGLAVGGAATLYHRYGADPQVQSPLRLAGALPPMTVQLDRTIDALTVTFDDEDAVLATATFRVESPLIVNVTVSLVGLQGTISSAP